MNVKKTRDYEVKCLLELLQAVANQTETPKWGRQPDWEELYKIADYHKVANMVYYALLGISERKLIRWKPKFEYRFHQAVVNEERFSTWVPRILAYLEKNKIHCMILREYRLRTAYPQPDMRALRYVRILVDKGKEQILRHTLAELDFEEQESRLEDELWFYKIPGIQLRFQMGIFAEQKKLKKYFSSSPRDYAREQGYHFVHTFLPHEYYLYVIGSIAQKYAKGSASVRDVLDFWCYYQKTHEEMDWNKIEKELTYLGLSDFSSYLIKLAFVWFDEMLFPEQEKFLYAMERYILSNGMEGRRESGLLLPLIKEVTDFYKKDSKKKQRQQMKKFLFPDMQYMKTMFPILEGFGVLVPFCYGIRLFRLGWRQFLAWLKKRFAKEESLEGTVMEEGTENKKKSL